MRPLVDSLRTAAADFLDDDCLTHAAAMAYYSIFSLPPLLLIVIAMAGAAGMSDARLAEILKSHLGIVVAQAPSSSPENGKAAEPKPALAPVSLTGKVAGIVLLIVSATGLFAQLQHALNRAWEVTPDPQQKVIAQFALKRILSLGMILVVAFLLLISLVLTTVIDELLAAWQGDTPGVAAVAIGTLVHTLLTLAVAMVLFATMFKVLPDARIAWRDVWVGAGVTAALFVVGESWIGRHLASSDLGATWGSAAASTVGVLVWVYYSTLIVLFGAEVTQAWARDIGRGIRPVEGAVHATHELHLTRR